VLRALERDPERRFPSALEFLSALERLVVPLATSRAVGEYVRKEVGEERLSLHWESASFPKGTALDDAPSEAAPAVSAPPLDDASLFVEPREDLQTRLHAPSPELVAATRSDEAPDAPLAEVRAPPTVDAYRVRRLVVALSLVLLGIAASVLLGATSPPTSPGPAPSAPPSQHAP
jgi:hypothetical protein